MNSNESEIQNICELKMFSIFLGEEGYFNRGCKKLKTIPKARNNKNAVREKPKSSAKDKEKEKNIYFWLSPVTVAAHGHFIF